MKKSEAKVLIITHSLSLTYGAARSLNLLLQGVMFDFDIIFNRKILRFYSKEQLREYAGPRCQNIYYSHLPLSESIIKAYEPFRNKENFLFNAIIKIKMFTRTLLSILSRPFLKKKICSKKYDLVYLNSSILYPLIYKKKKTVVHIREVLSINVPKKAQKRFANAYRCVCIDYATEKRFVESCSLVNKSNVVLVTNPFDMRDVFLVDKKVVLDKYGINEESIVFLIAGMITEEKGVEFVIEGFRRAQIPNSILLIAGVSRSSGESLTASREENILFLGEIKNMSTIYAITDVLVRGEDLFCTGRTVFEALFSGARVLMPGREDDLGKQHFEDDQKNRVVFYEPRNLDSLVKRMQSIKKIEKQKCKDNNLDEFYNKIQNVFK